MAGAAAGMLLAGSDALANTGTVAPNRPVVPLYGSISPFYGDINPFYGDISPFLRPDQSLLRLDQPVLWRHQSVLGRHPALLGRHQPVRRHGHAVLRDISPFWATSIPSPPIRSPKAVQPFWQSAGPQWGNLNTNWGKLQASGATDYSGLQTQLNAFVGTSAKFWGAAVQQATGEDFDDGFAAPMFAKYGIDPNDPNSLANASVDTRSLFFLNWYDGLMNYTGVDHVDWWMPRCTGRRR